MAYVCLLQDNAKESIRQKKRKSGASAGDKEEAEITENNSAPKSKGKKKSVGFA